MLHAWVLSILFIPEPNVATTKAGASVSILVCMLKYMTQSSCSFSSIYLATLNQLNHWLNMTWTKFLFLPLD